MTILRPNARDLIAAALRDHGDVLHDLRVDDLAEEDDVVLRRVGYRLVESGDRAAFGAGRRMLERAANGRLFPPPHKRWWTGPGKRTADLEAMLNPYSVELVWRDGRPDWEIGGRLWLHGVDRDWRWYPLLHVDPNAEWAKTDICWIRLGRRMRHAV
ncbi:hypothetical protein [Rhizobium ruizarguesonis]|jgi:hypothetical protein|uniref:hypothetical protein n=1 Tax=Rhizobium ruizarguesonis TaxID=2081791 RepID=UPI0010301B26|nr:hypothetical protein [Rhizobium ruizarguesonis]TBA24760.1 hypothetical protein ELH61_02610 [Rhizobium ruizarguesonis]